MQLFDIVTHRNVRHVLPDWCLCLIPNCKETNMSQESNYL